ncbi:MAG: DNA helicase UvrBC [Gemmataceae bacterium]
MSRDIDAVLTDWPRKPDEVQTRLVTAGDGRLVIQIRIDLGVMQLETKNRPDGDRPHGFPTYFHYLKSLAAKRGEHFVLSEEQCGEADREFVQFYHRRVAWLALRRFDEAVSDADHTITFMDFVRDHSPGDEYTAAHEQYRGFVLFHRTQAAAAAAVERDKPEQAIDEIRAGLAQLRRLRSDAEDDEDDTGDTMIHTLQGMEKSLRQAHGIDATLREQLERAIAEEEYEAAARLRDALRQRE